MSRARSPTAAKFTERASRLGALLPFVVLAGCATFTYGNQVFFTPQEALNAQTIDHAAIKASLPPAAKRVGGNIKFVLPTRDRIRATGITNPGAATPEGIEYIITTADRNYELMAELTRQRGAFDSVEVERRFDTAATQSDNTTFVVWLELPQAGTWAWYIRGPAGARQVVPLDESLPAGVLRSAAWCNSLETIASSLSWASGGEAYASKRRLPRPETATAGTGFFVSAEGFILTNAHVVEGCEAVGVAFHGTRLIGSVTARDKVNDLALIRTSARPNLVAPLRVGRAARPGEATLVVGFPLRGLLGSHPTITQGIVSNVAGVGDDTRLIQVSAAVQPGSSGGPVLDDAGNVIGIVVSKLNALTVAQAIGSLPENVNFAIKSDVAAVFLAAQGLRYQGSRGERRNPADIAEDAQKYTVALDCGG